MEKAIFPSNFMRITQGYKEGAHKDSFAIDNAGKDSGISDIYAPFTGVIRKIYPNDANEVWLESIDKVEYPDGTIDFMTVMFAHNNNIDDLFVGKRISQKEIFYKEGTKGNATRNHCHIECGKGRFTGNGWHKNASGYWSINNAKKPEECLFIDEDTSILDNHGYNFKKISTNVVDKKDIETNKKETVEDTLETKDDNKKNTPKKDFAKFEFIAPKTDLYGVYLKEKQKIIIEDLS